MNAEIPLVFYKKAPPKEVNVHADIANRKLNIQILNKARQDIECLRLIDYCTQCKAEHKGRFFKKPDQKDLLNYKRSEKLFREFDAEVIPCRTYDRMEMKQIVYCVGVTNITRRCSILDSF